MCFEERGETHLFFCFNFYCIGRGGWCDTQRVQYRKKQLLAAYGGVGLEKRLSPERIARLEALGFVWSPRKSRTQEERILERQRLYEENWEDYYQRLEHFQAVHGVSTSHRSSLGQTMLCAREVSCRTSVVIR